MAENKLEIDKYATFYYFMLILFLNFISEYLAVNHEDEMPEIKNACWIVHPHCILAKPFKFVGNI